VCVCVWREREREFLFDLFTKYLTIMQSPMGSRYFLRMCVYRREHAIKSVPENLKVKWKRQIMSMCLSMYICIPAAQHKMVL
jgi:hypothetical protein